MSWIWALHFFKDSDHLTPQHFLDALKHLHCHGRHIERYLSKYYSPNTHLTGEGLGLFYLGTQMPFFKAAERWRKLGEDILVAEIEKQILPDGVYFEQSLWYQRYTADFYLHFVILRAAVCRITSQCRRREGRESLAGRIRSHDGRDAA